MEVNIDSLQFVVGKNESTLCCLESFEGVLRNNASQGDTGSLRCVIECLSNSHALQRKNFFIDHLRSMNCRRFDWIPSEDEALSTAFLQGDVSLAAKSICRSGSSCLSRWKHHRSSSLNNSSWTKHEEVRLLELVHRLGGVGWSEIATSLSTSRSALQCFQRYQRSLNPTLASPDFSEEEDVRLEKLINKYAHGSWAVVAFELGGGHTPDQCARRWKQFLKPGLSQGRWTPEEDALLSALVKVFGLTRWSDLTSFMPGRTDVQARERWHDVLRPGLKGCSPWSLDEDNLLLERVATEGFGAWARISMALPGRTDHQCASRYLAMNGTSPVEYRRASRSKQQYLRTAGSFPLERGRILLSDFLQKPQP